MTFSLLSSSIPGNVRGSLLSFRKDLYRRGADASLLSLPPVMVASDSYPERIVLEDAGLEQHAGCVFLALKDTEPSFLRLGPIEYFPHDALFLGVGFAPKGEFSGCSWRHQAEIVYTIDCPNDPWWSFVRLSYRILA